MEESWRRNRLEKLMLKAATAQRYVDAERVSALLLGMINIVTARRRFDGVTEPLADDIDMAISTLFDGIGV